LLEDYARDGGKPGRIEFQVGDMLDPALGRFDHVVAMDSLIHYQSPDMVNMIGKLAASTRSSIVFTFAPRTPALTVLRAVGRFFPRQDRAPVIEPVDAGLLRQHLTAESALSGWREGRALRINTAFYKSYAMELAPR
jgi:magnesium-protoporphyrin O-methyltransferase